MRNPVLPRLLLAVMPWKSLESPSLPIGLLRASLVGAGHALPETYYGNIHWAEWLMSVGEEQLGVDAYDNVADNGLFDSLGDWVFAGALNEDPRFGDEQLEAYAHDHDLEVPIDLLRSMREHADSFMDSAVQEVLKRRPDVIGFTSTFMQNVPSLALAKRLKRADPSLVVVMGGGNCDGPMGVGLHSNFPSLDFVVRGEGEVALPLLMQAIAYQSSFAEVPGLCWRDAQGRQVVNDTTEPLPPGRLIPPDYDDWFTVLDASPIQHHIDPKLVLESARGCWWGEKHQCTFCGLNGSTMMFRAKSPAQVMIELTTLVERHQVLDVVMVDNIMDNRFFKSLLPDVAALDWDLRIHYEVKSNLRDSDVEVLRSAGVVHIQPGIESLVTPVLRLMDKGVTGTQNLRALRDAESVGLTVSWNWLYGFPGERYADYAPVLDQIPALVHLQPPSGASRILLERFSPHFDNPSLGFPERTVATAYKHVYKLPPAALETMVYLFDTPHAGLSDDAAELLQTALEQWQDAYRSSSLTMDEDNSAVVIHDARVGWPERDIVIVDPLWRKALTLLERPRSSRYVQRALVAEGNAVGHSEIEAWLLDLHEQGLVFADADSWLALPTRSVPQKNRLALIDVRNSIHAHA